MSQDDQHSYDPVALARANPQSRQKAINAFCCECMGGVVEGWKGAVRACTAPKCPLFPHRPYQ